MPWAKLDDRAHINAKLYGLSNEAYRLYMCGLSATQLMRQEGVVSAADIATISTLHKLSDPVSAIAELVKAEAWEEVDGGYYINDWHDWNRPDTEEAINKNTEKSRRRRARLKGEKTGDLPETDHAPHSAPGHAPADAPPCNPVRVHESDNETIGRVHAPPPGPACGSAHARSDSDSDSDPIPIPNQDEGLTRSRVPGEADGMIPIGDFVAHAEVHPEDDEPERRKRWVDDDPVEVVATQRGPETSAEAALVLREPGVTVAEEGRDEETERALAIQRARLRGEPLQAPGASR